MSKKELYDRKLFVDEEALDKFIEEQLNYIHHFRYPPNYIKIEIKVIEDEERS